MIKSLHGSFPTIMKQICSLFLMIMLTSLPFFASGQVFVPRAGFPYCQPFTGSGNPNDLPFTIAKGNKVLNYSTGGVSPDRPLFLTGNSLELTPDSPDERGYILIDLPFSSEYGIKASFEYFIYKESIGALGDGFSFFLIDGTETASTFEIGGVGGSLGYAPHGSNNGSDYSSVGVTGGYMGIGFDVLGNFGNYQEKKFGGFHDPNQFNYSTDPDDIKLYPDAITIRGPLKILDLNRDNGFPLINSPPPPSFNSYQFKGGKIVYFNYTGYPSSLIPRISNGSGDLWVSNPSFFLGTSDQFKIGSGIKPEDVDCGNTLPPGYRKVFIDIFPTGNPMEPYDITVEMLVDANLVPIKILDQVRFQGEAPQTLKVGFAASTGGNYFSKHEIRNLAVQVSSVQDAVKPVPPELFREVCIDEANTVEFPFCVKLPSSANAFIQCIQLYDINPGVGDNNFDTDSYDCGLSGFCALRCSDQSKRLAAFDAFDNKVGEFIAELDDEVEEGKFDQASIRFVRTNPNFYGTVTAWYKIVDNFGLESDGIPITISINPIPEIESSGTPTNPTCDGQNDGALNDIVVKNLVDDPGKYTIEFYDENNDPITFILAGPEVIGADGYITATFNLSGLNLGKIFVRAVNPSSELLGPVCDNNASIVSDPCVLEDELLFEFTQVRGTPVLIIDPIEEICENNPVSFQPDIDQYFKDNVTSDPVYLWYTDPQKTNKIDPNSDVIIVNGSPVTTGGVTIGANGLLTFDNLPAGNYDFFVEVDDTNFPTGGNFCFSQGDLIRVSLTVYPAIDLQVTELPDWCRNGDGSITVTAQGGTGNKTFNLYQLGNNTPVQQSPPQSGNQYTFTGLFPGDYEVEVITQNPSCLESIPVEVEGPTDPLSLVEGPTENAFCNGANGELKFTISGGNGGNLISIPGVPASSITNLEGVYTVTGLVATTYDINVTDGKDCSRAVSITVAGDPLPQFAATSDEICEGEIATVSPTIVNLSTSTPIYKWYYRDGPSTYNEITNDLNLNGVTFTIDGSNELSVFNLAPQATPYIYYLQVTGSKVCDQGYIPAEILVNPMPIPVTPTITQVTCNGESNGIIQAQLASGNLEDFQYSLHDENGISGPFANNSGLFNSLPPGTYALTVKSNKDCEAIFPGIIITEPSPLVSNEVSKVDATCAEDNGQLSFTVSGGNQNGSGGYTISVNGSPLASFGADLTTVPGTNDFTLTNLSPDTYDISITDAKGCTDQLSITIGDTDIPEYDVNDVTVCEGTPVVVTPIEVSNTIGATPVYTWSFEDLTGNLIEINDGDRVGDLTYDITNGVLTITGLTFSPIPFSYFMGVAGDKICAAAPIEAKVTILKIPVANFTEVPVSCFGGNDGKINMVLVDPAGPNTFTLLETGASNSTGNFSGLSAGNYNIRVQEAGSFCPEEFPVTVTQPAQLEIIDQTKIDPTCGDSNGSVKFEITGGVTPYTLVMNNLPISAYLTSLTAGVYEVKNLAPGEYSLAITDVNDCPLNLPNLFTLTNETGFNVEVNPMKDVVCVGQDLVFSPVFIPMLSVTPVLSWYKDAALNQPITSSPTPDSEGITYQVDPADGRLTISDQSAGNFNYYLEISGPGICTFVEVADAEVFAAIEADITVDNITCFGNTDGVITIVPRGGNGVFEVSFDSSPFTTDLTYSNLAPGSYTVEIRNDIGCPFAETVLVEGPTAPISINSPTIERASCDLANGSIRDLVITGGWGNYTVEWRAGSITGSVISGTVSEALDLLPNTYYLIVSDTEGCLSIFDFLVEESSDPVYAIVPPVNSCVGSPVVIRPLHIAPDLSLPPAAATEVRWYTDPGQIGLIQNGADPVLSSVNYTIDDTDWLHPELVITGLPAGTYDFYFYVVCTGQEIPVSITVFDTPAVVLDTTPITCFGDTNGKVSILSGALSMYTYSIDGAAPISQLAFEALSLAAGTYALTVSTPAGCAQTETFTIDGPTAPLASSPLIKIDPGCGAPNGKLNLTITGGWLPYTLDVLKDGVSLGLQSINQNTISLDGYRPGVYQIRITDKEGCSVITNTVTLVDGPTQLLVDSDEICVGSVASLMPELNPIAAGASFQWFLDATTTESIISSPSPAGDGRIYQINTATGELTIGNLPASVTEYSYYVTASGAGVCPGFTGNGKVRVYSNPTATATVVNEVCFGAGGSIVINTTGDSGSYTYSLNGGAFGSTNVFQVATGTHNVQVRTSAGCLVNIANIPVAGPGAALSTSDLSKDNASCGLDNGEVRFTISGGYAPYTITYTKNGSNAGSADLITAGEVRISNLGIGIYEFKVLDAQGCSITVPNTVTITEVPTVLTANDDAICHGEVAQSTPSVPQNIVKPQFFWSFDPQGTSPISTGTLDGVTYSINSLGALSVEGLSPRGAAYTYYVKVSGVGICGLEAKPVSIKVYKIPLLRVSNPSIICDPTGTVDLTDFIEGFNPNIYDYRIVSPSDNAMRLDELASVAVSGDYRVSSSLKGTGCFNQAQRIRVLIADTALVADFQYEADLGGGILLPNAEIQIQENVNFLDLSQGNVLIWDWDFGDGNSSSSQNPVHQYQEKGVYTVMLTAIDSIGCISTYQVVVEVLNDYAVMIPNAFTPTGTKNLTFRPYYRGIASMEFYIFSTWGELIYEAKSMEDQGWDGTLNGENVPNGNYVFKGRFVSKSGEMIDKSGVFILIR